jgi:hypothetical protein
MKSENHFALYTCHFKLVFISEVRCEMLFPYSLQSFSQNMPTMIFFYDALR